LRIAIYSRDLAENYVQFVHQLLQKLAQHNIQVVLYQSFFEQLKNSIELNSSISSFKTNKELHNIDYMFSVGGDGTLLETVSFVKELNIPILGINAGRLGFLTSVSNQEIDFAIESILSKNYTLDNRFLLDVHINENPFGDLNFALNEVTIQKRDSSSMITIHAFLDGVFLNSYWADGLIIATPTGSTAYSLSCNGPIVLPNTENIIITPIAPHNLNVRPLIIPDNSEIKLKIEGREENYLVALDYKSATIPVSTEIIIKKSNTNINLIRFENHDFFNTLRNKLMWGLDKRN